MRAPLTAVLGLLGLLAVFTAGCACEQPYCDDTGCYYCDGYGCRPVGPAGPSGADAGDAGTGSDVVLGPDTPAGDGGSGTGGGGGGASCARDSDCGIAGWQCRDGRCVLPCSSDGQCGLECVCVGGACGPTS